MYRIAVFLLLPLAACATQSQQAFTPRPASAPELHVDAPNLSAARDQNLEVTLERSLEQQESFDQANPSGARVDLRQAAVAPPRDPLAVDR